MNHPKLILLTGAALTVASPSHAAIVAMTESSIGASFTDANPALRPSWASQISTTDLINSGRSTFSNAVVGTTHASFPAGGLNDGVSTNAVPGGNTFFRVSNDFSGTPSTTSATFNLNVSVNTLGYTITSIQSFMGWVGSSSQAQANQTYTVAVSLIGSAAFTDIATVAYTPFTDVNGANMESHVVLTENTTGILASGVDSIRFTFLNPLSSVANGGAGAQGTVIRELDVIGIATVPEPGSLACTALAGALLLRRRRN